MWALRGKQSSALCYSTTRLALIKVTSFEFRDMYIVQGIISWYIVPSSNLQQSLHGCHPMFFLALYMIWM